MRSPFPGMDPYLEDPARWPDLHLRLIAGLSEVLQAELRPRYVVRAEERVYLSWGDDGRRIRPDVAVLEGATRRRVEDWRRSRSGPG